MRVVIRFTPNTGGGATATDTTGAGFDGVEGLTATALGMDLAKIAALGVVAVFTGTTAFTGVVDVAGVVGFAGEAGLAGARVSNESPAWPS